VNPVAVGVGAVELVEEVDVDETELDDVDDDDVDDVEVGDEFPADVVVSLFFVC